jgi:hypothetical protein
MTQPQSHRALRVLLLTIAIVEAVAGLILVFATRNVFATVPGAPWSHDAGLVTALLKAIGVVAMTMGYLLWAASRDPERYVAVVDALVFLLAAAAILNLYGATALRLGVLYPPAYLVTRAVVQLLLAGTIVALRPRAGRATARPADERRTAG